MRTPTRSTRIILGAVLFAATALVGCDSIDQAAESQPDDIQIAADIVGSVLAESDGGLMANIQDITADVTETSLGNSRFFPGRDHPDRAACRGGYGMVYDQDTGTHRVRYTCSVRTLRHSRTSSANLAYQFRTATGEAVPRPSQDWASVDSIRFRGSRSGSVRHGTAERAIRVSTFEQNATWGLRNLVAAGAGSGAALLRGLQTQSGIHGYVDSTGRNIEREYVARINTDSVEIRASEDGVLNATTGSLDYVVQLTTYENGEPNTRVIEGSVDLEGNGAALLRFVGLRTVYRISLADGRATVDRPNSYGSTRPNA